jgi:hypothetical protein
LELTPNRNAPNKFADDFAVKHGISVYVGSKKRRALVAEENSLTADLDRAVVRLMKGGQDRSDLQIAANIIFNDNKTISKLTSAVENAYHLGYFLTPEEREKILEAEKKQEELDENSDGESK